MRQLTVREVACTYKEGQGVKIIQFCGRHTCKMSMTAKGALSAPTAVARKRNRPDDGADAGNGNENQVSEKPYPRISCHIARGKQFLPGMSV